MGKAVPLLTSFSSLIRTFACDAMQWWISTQILCLAQLLYTSIERSTAGWMGRISAIEENCLDCVEWKVSSWYLQMPWDGLKFNKKASYLMLSGLGMFTPSECRAFCNYDTLVLWNELFFFANCFFRHHSCWKNLNLEEILSSKHSVRIIRCRYGFRFWKCKLTLTRWRCISFTLFTCGKIRPP